VTVVSARTALAVIAVAIVLFAASAFAYGASGAFEGYNECTALCTAAAIGGYTSIALFVASVLGWLVGRLRR
jgi:hypothetical protein